MPRSRRWNERRGRHVLERTRSAVSMIANRLQLAFVVVAGALCATAAVQAQQGNATAYPQKPVKIIVNVSPGGGVDTATRLVAQRLAHRLGAACARENPPRAP